MRATAEQLRRVAKHALDFCHDVGDCLFCTLHGTDVAAWHEDFCPLRDIDPHNRPPKSTRQTGDPQPEEK